MSSRYYNDHHYDSYHNRSANGPAPSRRRTYDYVKINPLLKKAKAKSTGYSTALGRRKPKGEWKAKRREEADHEEQDIRTLKSRKDVFDAEAVEAELNTFKKGTFVFEANAEAPKKKEAPKSMAKLNGDSKHSKFLLKRTNKKHPHSPMAEYYYPRPSTSKSSGSRNGGRRSKDDDSKESSPDKSEDLPQRSRGKKSSRQRKSEKMRVQTIVTVSPSRISQYGGYVRSAVPDYFYGPGHGPPQYYPGAHRPYYGQPQRRALPVGAAVPGYGSYHDPAGAMEYYYGNTMEDGAWYPYPDVAAPRAPAPDAFSTPKTKRSKSSANVDLTSPTKAVANGDTPMSPGRRVNKIQKQLEYYFSAENMNEDKFLLSVMDESGWVTTDTILKFKRMKTLGATKELVTEAAFHSTAIEIDVKNERIRMNKLWKQYVGKRKKGSSPKKRSSSSSKERERERQRQKELDEAELNDETIEAIVAAIEKKQERRERRRREREIAKERAKKKEERKEDTVDQEEEEAPVDDKEEEDTKQGDDCKEEAAKNLIIEDQQQGDDEVGDPDGDDMVNID